MITAKVTDNKHISDGIYNGIWGGWEVSFDYNGEKRKIETSIGVRGFNIPVKVKVNNEKIIVETV